MARDKSNAEALTSYFGLEAYEEYLRVASKLDRDHLGDNAPKNLIFVPGIMGSLLFSRARGGVWWIDVRTRHHINDLALAPNGKEDADPANQIVPFTTDPTYEPFLSAILLESNFGHEVFPYDWRKPLYLSTAALRDLIGKLYAENGNNPVHLVAHSMGGLMVRAALMEHGKELWPKIGRIVFIGTPHYGSPAIAGYLKNHLWGFDLMAVLGLYLSRDTFRSLWGALSMLPAPRGVYPGTRPKDSPQWNSGHADDTYQHPCANFDMYKVNQWALDLMPEKTSELQNILDTVAAFYKRMQEAHDALNQDMRDRMLVIAGVGYQTLFRLEYESRFFGIWEHMAKVTCRIPGDIHREGDGRVPLASATLDNTPIRYVKGVHGGLPNIPAVYNDVFNWLNEKDMKLPDKAYEALSAHLSPEESESITPELDGTAKATPLSDNAGLWDGIQPDRQRLDVLLGRLDGEKLPEFSRVRIL